MGEDYLHGPRQSAAEVYRGWGRTYHTQGTKTPEILITYLICEVTYQKN